MSAAGVGIDGAVAALDAAKATSMRAWMERHRNELLAHQDGRRINWTALCVWFASVGLVNDKGEAPTVRCAKMTWYRVGKWLERQHARATVREAEELPREALLTSSRQETLERQRTKEPERQSFREHMAATKQTAARRRSQT